MSEQAVPDQELPVRSVRTARTADTDRTARTLMRRARVGLVAVAVVGTVGWDLPTLLANLDVYQPLSLELAGYGWLIVVCLVSGWLIARDRPWGRWRWPLLASVYLACAVATAAVPPDQLLGPAHWSWELVAWFCAALLLDLPIGYLASALGLHFVTVLAQLAAAHRWDRASLVEASVVAMLNIVGALTLGYAGTYARRIADTSETMAAQEASLSTANRIAEELQDDRRARYADIAATAAPLLEGLRTGRLSPEDPVVRRRCAVEAARLRRQMAERDDVADAFGHELRACIDVAQRAGLAVQVSMQGDRPELELPMRRALTESVTAMLARATSSARVTVVGTGAEVVVSVVTDLDPAGDADVFEAPEAGLDGLDAELLHHGGRAWLTLRGRAA